MDPDKNRAANRFLHDQRAGSAAAHSGLLEQMALRGETPPLSDPDSLIAGYFATVLTQETRDKTVTLCEHVTTRRYQEFLCWIPRDGLMCRDCASEAIADLGPGRCDVCGLASDTTGIVFPIDSVIVLAQVCTPCLDIADREELQRPPRREK